MKHPVLGVITIENGDGVANVPFRNGHIRIRIFADEIPYDATVEIAASVVENLQMLDSKAKHVAAAALTDGYNSGWNEYDEVQDDGTLKAVSNPTVTPDEFSRKLTLKSVNVTGNMVDLIYDNENMFWGHSVVVTSRDGVAFTNTHSEIFG